jgi:hypothetical protein
MDGWVGGGASSGCHVGFVYHFRAFKWPSHASALPLLMILESFDRKLCRSSSVQSGCSGIKMSMSVRLAAHSRLALRGERLCETARMVPKPRVALAGARCEEVLRERWRVGKW